MTAPAIQSSIRITSHAVGVVLNEVLPSGEVRCARMLYEKRGSRTVRHIMETGERGETVRQTLESCFHEAARDRGSFRYELTSDEPILVEFGDDQENPGGKHMKVFFGAMVKSGALRDFILPDGDETLGPIVMDESSEILRLLRETEGKTVPVHVRATRASILPLAGDRRVFDRYQKLVLSTKPVMLTDEQEAAVAAYPGKW
ncbi:hypothetical protein KW785_02305 [Candidatus Parcubacteria bacterium]|nr:hypothetical protein [Candidatus Parcubacteria bacterium]